LEVKILTQDLKNHGRDLQAGLFLREGAGIKGSIRLLVYRKQAGGQTA
jgi:hypothetical protein